MTRRNFLISILIFLPQLLLANADNPYHDLNLFYQRVWSPYCKGNSLLECPSSQAQELRDELKDRYDAGSDFDELQVFLKSVYGDQVRMEPESGFRGGLAYLIPLLAFSLIAIFLAFYWRRRIRPSVHLDTAKSNQKVSSRSEIQREIDEESAERLS